MKVCVLGLGEVGFPTAEYIFKQGLEVWGYDISQSVVTRAKMHGIQRAFTEWSEVPNMDAYVICVSTKLVNDTFDLNPVFNVCEKIAGNVDSSALVSIESTIVPFTCEKISKSIFREKIALVHVPHRFWPEDPLDHGVNQLRVIGALNAKSLAK